MFKQIFIMFLCFNLIGCGGFSFRGALQFDKTTGSKTYPGNPGFTSNVLKLKNGDVISFYRPMGECGGGVVLFVAVIVPIPVWFHLNTCDNEIAINSSSQKILKLQIKYDGKIYDTYDTVASANTQEMFKSIGYNKTYKFKIGSFKDFKHSKDKVLIVITKDGTIQELPIEWKINWYNDWSII